MKTVQFILCTLAIACLTSTSTFAKEKPNAAKEEVRDKIVEMIKNNRPDITNVPDHKLDATIEFVVTDDGKLVLLEVDAADGSIDNYLRNQLNYKKFKVPGAKVLTPYRIDITFRTSS